MVLHSYLTVLDEFSCHLSLTSIHCVLFEDLFELRR